MKRTDNMTTRFTKMTGCGNDFIIIERVQLSPNLDLSALGRIVCDRRLGIGADGLIVIGPGNGDAQYGVVIINAMGLPAEMCGNGARCVARYCYERGLAPANHCFDTVAGEIQARVEPGQVRIRLTDPGPAEFDRQLQLDSESVMVDAIDTGVPHAVRWVDDIEAAPVERLGPLIRHHPAFPRGTNTNFAQIEAGGLALRTFERGVEAETLACGTGSAAAAILAYRRGHVQPPVRVRTRQGSALTIDFRDEAGIIRDVWLIGPTTTICRGELSAELWD